jgi:choline dehydrogenase
MRAGVYPHPFPGFTVSAVHLRPDARGDVRLKRADSLAPPAIRFNFLKTSHDLKR